MFSELNQEYSCPVCLGIYFQPVSLQKCHHVFCASCIDDMVGQMNLKKCPLCRVPFQPDDVVEEKNLCEKILKIYPN